MSQKARHNFSNYVWIPIICAALILLPFTIILFANIWLSIFPPEPLNCSDDEKIIESECVALVDIKGVYPVENLRETDGTRYGGINITIDKKRDMVMSYSTGNRFGFWDSKESKLNTGNYYIYVDPKEKVFRVTTKDIIDQKKANGELCYSEDESWHIIGRDACVAFHSAYAANVKGLILIDEKTNYREGFVAVARGNFLDWDTFTRIQNELNPHFAAVGLIERYEGHPQIQVYNHNQLTIAEPFAYNSSEGFVYKPGTSFIK